MADRSTKERFRIFGPAVLVTLVGFVVAYQFVKPAPPKEVTIATGGTEGAYFAFGQRYREILAENGIHLEVRSTAGSVENAELLRNGDSGVEVAFVQGQDAILESGLVAGDRVVLTDLVPAIAGMLLAPQDEAAAR